MLRISIIFVTILMSFAAQANTPLDTQASSSDDPCAISLDTSVEVADLQTILPALSKKSYRVDPTAKSKVLSVKKNCAEVSDNSVCEVSVKIFCERENRFEQNQFRMIKTDAEINFERASRRLIKKAIKGFTACAPHPES